MPIVLIGANGQLGSDLTKVLKDEDLVPLTHSEIEITSFRQVSKTVEKYRPDIVINTAAYHKVDECEKNVAKSFEVNAFGVRNLALCCNKHGAVLFHLSTDYVFDGRKTEPYTELDTPNPINCYGVSKLAGECFVKYILDRYFLVRTSGLYGVVGSSGKGGNFVELMLGLAKARSSIRVVDDQVLSPTCTVDLAQKIKKLIGTSHFGLYHITNSGHCSWYEFAKKIFELSNMEVDLQKITTEEFGAMANRPRYSVLKSCLIEKIGIAHLRTWDKALEAYLGQRQDQGPHKRLPNQERQ